MNPVDEVIVDSSISQTINTSKDALLVDKSISIKKKRPIRDAIIFSLIFIVVLIWSYSIYLWMICCFNWSTHIYKTALASIVAASIITIVAIIIVIVLSKLR